MLYPISILLLSVPTMVTWLELSTFGWWGKCFTTVLTQQAKKLTCVSNISSIPVSTLVYGLKLSTLGWWKCLTIVLPLLANKLTYVFLNFLHSCGIICVWTQILNLGKTKQVFYHCANTAGKEVNLRFLYFLHPSANAGVWTQTLNFLMSRQLFYHCANIAGKKVNLCFLYFLHPSVNAGVWTQTLNHQMMWSVFYHCATIAGL